MISTHRGGTQKAMEMDLLVVPQNLANLIGEAFDDSLYVGQGDAVLPSCLLLTFPILKIPSLKFSIFYHLSNQN